MPSSRISFDFDDFNTLEENQSGIFVELIRYFELCLIFSSDYIVVIGLGENTHRGKGYQHFLPRKYTVNMIYDC